MDYNKFEEDEFVQQTEKVVGKQSAVDSDAYFWAMFALTFLAIILFVTYRMQGMGLGDLGGEIKTFGASFTSLPGALAGASALCMLVLAGMFIGQAAGRK